VIEKSDKYDDGNWHAEQPEQYSTPHKRLLFDSALIAAPSKRASLRFVPAKHLRSVVGGIIAGAVVASALSLALLMLGAGLGLVSVSPWSTNNVSVTAFGILAAAWFIAVQLFASGVGGYLAGRLRTRWVSVHTDEVYSRDTAHGLIVWGVGAIVTAWLLTSGDASVVSGAAHAGGSALEAAGTAAAGPAAQVAGHAASREGSSAAYFTDLLFRTDRPDASGDPAAARAEVGRILATDALSGEMPAADRTYVAQVIAARTGLSQADAGKWVSDVVEQKPRIRRSRRRKPQPTESRAGTGGGQMRSSSAILPGKPRRATIAVTEPLRVHAGADVTTRSIGFAFSASTAPSGRRSRAKYSAET
jgi:hypothetical protein